VRDVSRDSTQLAVGSSVQTFLDNVLIESVLNITRRWHQPQRRSDGPVLQRDRPWEHTLYLNYDHIVLRDAEDGLFKCWYEDMHGPLPHVSQNFGRFARKLYAESEDGLHWRKPELGIYEVDGRNTNIVLGDEEHGQTASGTVIIDPNPPSRHERYRMMYTRLWENETGPGSRIEAAHSADGIHWEVYDTLPTFGSAGTKLGDVSMFFYDEYAREFIQTTRHTYIEAGHENPRFRYGKSFFRPREPHNPAKDSQRRVWLTRSHDFIHWSEPILIAATDDEQDNLDESYYAMPIFQVGNMYLGMAGVLRAVDNETHVQLLTSRDMVRWKNTNKRQPFFYPRGEGHWDARMVCMCSAPIEVGDELWFFYGGANSRHDWWFMGAFGEEVDHEEARDPSGVQFGLGLATLRREGFAGLFANRAREGYVVTRPLRSRGAQLVINGKCAAGGYILVEVTDGDDEVLQGYSREEADAFRGDGVEHVVSWSGSSLMPTGTTKRGWPEERKLRFFFRDAELFSFRFTGGNEDGFGEGNKAYLRDGRPG